MGIKLSTNYSKTLKEENFEFGCLKNNGVVCGGLLSIRTVSLLKVVFVNFVKFHLTVAVKFKLIKIEWS